MRDVALIPLFRGQPRHGWRGRGRAEGGAVGVAGVIVSAVGSCVGVGVVGVRVGGVGIGVGGVGDVGVDDVGIGGAGAGVDEVLVLMWFLVCVT